MLASGHPGLKILYSWLYTVCVCVCARALPCSVAQSCLTLRDLMGYRPPGSSVHGILQARTLEWIAMPSSKRSSRPRDWALGLLPCSRTFYHLSRLGSPTLHCTAHKSTTTCEVHAHGSVRQTHELTYVTGHATTHLHLWKFTTWGLLCREGTYRDDCTALRQ